MEIRQTINNILDDIEYLLLNKDHIVHKECMLEVIDDAMVHWEHFSNDEKMFLKMAKHHTSTGKIW